MDSMVDLNDTNVSMQEASARLHRLEGGYGKDRGDIDADC